MQQHNYSGKHYLGDRAKSVYLTTSLNEAKMFALRAAKASQGDSAQKFRPTVLKIALPMRVAARAKPDAIYGNRSMTVAAVKAKWIKR